MSTPNELRKQAQVEATRTGLSEADVLAKWLSNEIDRVPIVDSSTVLDERGNVVRFKYQHEMRMSDRWSKG